MPRGPDTLDAATRAGAGHGGTRAMSIGIRLHDAQGADARGRADWARANGFASAQLAPGKVYGADRMEPAALTPGFAARVRRDMGGLAVPVLGCYLNLAHPDEAEYARLLAVYTAHLRFARWLGAGVVGTETGNPNAACRYDPARSHTREALERFVDRLRPAVDAAEKLGAVLALEPVYSHIVCDAKRMRYVLDTVRSPNLMVILDFVNLLHPDNIAKRDAVLDEALDLLLPDTAALHIKDYRAAGGNLLPAPAGAGDMDYGALFARVAPLKPHIDLLLEEHTPRTAPAAAGRIRALWERAGGEGAAAEGAR